jgi:hypothetical protein
MTTAMGMSATGVIVRNRSTGLDFGMHEACQLALFSEAGITNPLDDSAPAVVIGPLFADPSDWTCPYCKGVTS